MSATCEDGRVRVPESSVVVVGAGISGLACARELADAGVDVVVLDRARVVGGRMARWTRDDRVIDVGAAYFTTRDPAFAALAESWAQRGLAHPWADTFSVADATGIVGSTTGPMRWGAEGGLRSLVADLADGLDVRTGTDVQTVGAGSAAASVPGPTLDGKPVRGVVLAMPDPQARDLLGDDLAALHDDLEAEWQPVVTVVASFAERTWTGLDAVFVHDSPVSLIVDDGRRRGDNAPVLVAHSTHEIARDHLDDPDAVIPLALAQMSTLVGSSRSLGEPAWVEAKRWGSATPVRARSTTYGLDPSGVAVCGDGWSSRPRIEAAWLSGRDAGRALAAHLR
jgi:predicted NAD/FAD-dependent oxidoreductase